VKSGLGSTGAESARPSPRDTTRAESRGSAALTAPPVPAGLDPEARRHMVFSVLSLLRSLFTPALPRWKRFYVVLLVSIINGVLNSGEPNGWRRAGITFLCGMLFVALPERDGPAKAPSEPAQ
jgi:hypothetical protein